MSLRTDITLPRSPRARLGMLIAVLALGGSLTACSNAGSITCGEFTDQDEGAQRDTVVDLIEDSDDDDVKGQLEDVEGEERDAFLDQYAQLISGECDSRGEDTEVGDIVYEES